MKIYKLFVLFLLVLFTNINAQVGINTETPDPSSVLDIVAKNSDRGLLIPRIPLLSDTDVTTIVNPTVSLLVFNTTSNANITQGFYYWDGSKWRKFSDKAERLFYGTSDPVVSSTNLAGDIYVNQTTGVVFAYNGTNWVSQMSGTEIQFIKIIATDGQVNFTAPWSVTTSNTKVYRNGVNVDFTVVGTNTIVIEPSAVCYSNDEIKIYKFL